MKKNREQELLARLALVQRVSLAEAMELFDTSESTIRRLFTRLEQEGKAIRTHGGIQNVSRSMADYSFEYGARTNIEKKTAIARQACQYLVDGDVVFCDSGTTMLECGAFLSERLAARLLIRAGLRVTGELIVSIFVLPVVASVVREVPCVSNTTARALARWAALL